MSCQYINKRDAILQIINKLIMEYGRLCRLPEGTTPLGPGEILMRVPILQNMSFTQLWLDALEIIYDKKNDSSVGE